MLIDERHARIREMLAAEGRVLAADLAREFGVSEDTARRDLRELARIGACRRVYGGALRPAPELGTIAQRQGVKADNKLRLAGAVAKLLLDGQTVFVDAGSTNLALAQSIPDALTLTIVTNAPAIALALAEHPRCRAIMLGGDFVPGKGACIGSRTIRDTRRIHADLVVLGTCGVEAETGVTAHDADEAEVKRTMVEQSRGVIVPATSDKVGTVARFAVAPAGGIDHLVVDGDADPSQLAAFGGLGVHIHRA